MIQFNIRDCMFYGTNAERVASPITNYAPTDKFYEFDTNNIYVSDGTQWYLI